jgi:GntR family transcriptional regulator
MQITPLLFEVHPSSGVPIYRQIMDQVRALIAGGKLATGDVLPSVRQMAAELGINMMTVSKAYSKLEAEGVVSRSRGQGMVVDRVDVGGTVADRRKELQPFAEQLVVRGIQLSLSDEQMLSVVKSSQRDLRETASA